jgi:hypothetical protein
VKGKAGDSAWCGAGDSAGASKRQCGGLGKRQCYGEAGQETVLGAEQETVLGESKAGDCAWGWAGQESVRRAGQGLLGLGKRLCGRQGKRQVRQENETGQETVRGV